jgi:hypothetical protein
MRLTPPSLFVLSIMFGLLCVCFGELRCPFLPYQLKTECFFPLKQAHRAMYRVFPNAGESDKV